MEQEQLKQFTFYELYTDILSDLSDVDAGKFAKRICEYEFENAEPNDAMTDKEVFYWSNISDMLAEVKEIETQGRIPKKYNLRAKHFTFYDTYYNAMKLLNDRQSGAFVKAICAYMFNGNMPNFNDKTMQGYFNLCKRKMDISNQPIIFNISYTPWKIKRNATAEERAKFERERPYYEMSDGGNNIYKYITSDRKLNGENSKTETRSLIDYFQKSTGVFDGDGIITQEQLKAIQRRAQAEKNI